MARDNRVKMSVVVILSLLFSIGDSLAVQQKIRLDVPGVT
ncbi:MAG: hypothetical protein H6Q93_1390 [Nitrospirae bacterium]|jgi:hypothetical protein|nr:hypothetical protein [Nitrospirota bacterium]